MIALGTRLVMDAEDQENYECTACGRGLRGIAKVVAVPRRKDGFVMYALAHNTPECVAAVA